MRGKDVIAAVFHSSAAPNRASARLRVVSQENQLGQILSVPCASAVAGNHQSHPWGCGRITWRSAAVTRFMSAVPESGRFQLPVSGVLRIKSVFSPVRGAWVESNTEPYPYPGVNCINGPRHYALRKQFDASLNRTMERTMSTEPATRLRRCARVRGQYQASSPR